MKVILLQDISGTGKKEQIIEVSDGYARNFLFPRKMAIEATDGQIKKIRAQKDAVEHRQQTEKSEAQALAKSMNGSVVVVKAKAGDGSRLFGAVTSQEVAAALKSQYNIDIDKRKIDMPNIKTLGETAIEIKLHAGVPTRLIVKVEREG